MPLDQIDVDKIDSDQKNGQEEKEMTFLEHLEELRWHLVRAISSILIFAIAAYLGGTPFFELIFYSPKLPDFPTYKLISKIIPGFEPQHFDLITKGLAESFLVHIKASIMLGFMMSFPYILWEVWRFVKPGLYDNERKAARGFVFICTFLFTAGVLFGYFVIAPFAIKFLTSYDMGAINAPTLDSYVTYMIMFTLPTGIIFQLPVLVFFLTKIGLIDAEFMRTYRRHAVVLILVLSAMITPPDVITQFLISIPLFFLYELSISIAKRVKAQEEEMEKKEQGLTKA